MAKINDPILNIFKPEGDFWTCEKCGGTYDRKKGDCPHRYAIWQANAPVPEKEIYMYAEGLQSIAAAEHEISNIIESQRKAGLDQSREDFEIRAYIPRG